MPTRGLRIGVLGATGVLGSEVLAALSQSSIGVRAIVPIAGDASLGCDIEFQDESYPVETEVASLRGIDLVFLCAPPGVSLEFARRALRAEVPCIDCSGALASSEEVPLLVADLGPDPPEAERAPLVATPAGPALAWSLVLRPLHESAGIARVVGTLLEGASVGGRQGVESLYAESLAIFNQEEAPEPSVFGHPIAFDCLPAVGEFDAAGQTERERDLLPSLERLLGTTLQLAATAVQVPTFLGHGACLAIETERGLPAAEAATLLEKAPGVELWREGGRGPTTRTAAARDAVQVGRLRDDPSRERGLLLWLAADLLRLSAANAVALAAARLRVH